MNLSSETVPGMSFAERPFFAPYAPIDEELENRPQDPYALAKLFGEQLMDAAVARSDLRAISIRPTWVQWEGNYARSLGPWLRDPLGGPPSGNFWSYIDAYDLATRSGSPPRARCPGTRSMYIAAADNAAGRPLRELIAHHFGESVEVRGDPPARGISIAKARRLLGYAPSRSWRDYLSADGKLLPAARERLERGETGVQRGRAALG